MLKVFRKYNKWIMVVGGSLLMVTFLFTGTANQFQPDPGKRVVATTDEAGPIRARDLAQAEAEWAVLKDLQLTSLLPIEDSGLHWHLLTLEAQNAGLVGGPEDGVAFYEEAAGQFAIQLVQSEAYRTGDFSALTDPVVRQERVNMVMDELRRRKDMSAAGRGGLTARQVDMALAKLRGVMRLTDLYASVPRISRPRAIAQVRRVQDSVAAQGFVVPAELYLAQAPEPTEAQILAHYEKYREVTPGSTADGNTFGFGYVQPPRVKLEWMTIDRQQVLDAIRLDPVAVNKHWLQNRPRFPGEFEAERARVEQELRNEKLAAVMSEADRLVRARVQAATRKLEQDEDYRVLPEDWAEQRPRYTLIAEELVDSVKAATGVEIPKPVVTTVNQDWVRLDEVSTLPGIGQTQFRAGTVQGPITQLISAERNLTPANGLIVQAGVPFVMGEIADRSGNRYYLTVLDVRPTAPPASLDEVRRQVVTDLKKLNAYELMLADRERIERVAETDGLDAAIAALPESDSRAAPTKLESIRISGVQVMSAEPALDARELRSAVMAAAYDFGYTAEPAPENRPQRTVVEALPRALSLGVVQIEKLTPFTGEQFRRLPPAAASTLVQFELDNVDLTGLQGMFSLPAVQKRLGYTSRTDSPADEAPQG